MDTLVVMGNGPSLGDINFKNELINCDTFGLNQAYRAYPRMDWYPTYFGCFDYVVTNCHKKNYIDVVKNSPIQKGFFITPLLNHKKFQYINLKPFNEEKFPPSFDYFYDGGNSGANACQVGILLGYKKIIIVGVDCDYVEQIEEAEEVNGKLRITKTPEKNPNYWFDDYQQVGDEYNIPRANKFHKPAWQTLAKKAKKNNIDIVNCSEKSKLECFRFSDLKTELKL